MHGTMNLKFVEILPVVSRVKHERAAHVTSPSLVPVTQGIHKNMQSDAMHLVSRICNRICRLRENFSRKISVNLCQTSRRHMASQPFARPQVSLTWFEVIFNVTIKCDVIL